jgi:hypothetical protein
MASAMDQLTFELFDQASSENESVLHRVWQKALILSWTNFIAIQVFLVR